jgi:tryptophan synthase alpha chain
MHGSSGNHGVEKPISAGLRSGWAKVKETGKIGLLPFIPAGFPDLETTRACIEAVARAGATAVEIGFPFSDPIADGPVIQGAFQHALDRGIRVADIFDTMQGLGPITMPRVAMVSYSIIHRFGPESFVRRAAESGFSGILAPDLPLPEARDFCRLVNQAGLDTVMLVSPSTPAERRELICQLCTGFVYFQAVAGVTGERSELPSELIGMLAAVRQVADCPVAVGFGLSTAQHVAMLQGHADGAIVGSALVRSIGRLLERGRDEIAGAVGSLVEQLLAKCS